MCKRARHADTVSSLTAVFDFLRSKRRVVPPAVSENLDMRKF